jgi:hypothetical protein
MDPTRFDRLAMTLSQRTTRRTAVGLLAALGLAGLLRVEAAAACISRTGARCGRENDLECCSGRCVRKRGTGKKFCRPAPGQGICTINQDVCQSLAGTSCSSEDVGCACRRTTQGYSFCGGGSTCFNCETDADCEKRIGGHRGDRCVQCSNCTASNGRSCTFPCAAPTKA